MNRQIVPALVAVLACAPACASDHSRASHGANEVIPIAPAAPSPDEARDASTPPQALTTAPSAPEPPAEPGPPPAVLLARILEAARADVYAASSRLEAGARLERLEADLVAEQRIPTSVLAAARDNRNRDLASLHAGPVRVYPAPRTMDWMLGIAGALEHAVKRRAP